MRTIHHRGRVYEVVESATVDEIAAKFPRTADELRKNGGVARLTLRSKRGRWATAYEFDNGTLNIVAV